MARNSENRNTTSRNSYGSDSVNEKQTSSSYNKNKSYDKTSGKTSGKMSNRNSNMDDSEDSYDKEY